MRASVGFAFMAAISCGLSTLRPLVIPPCKILSASAFAASSAALRVAVALDILLTSCFAGPGIFVIFSTRRFLTASMKTSLADRGRIAEDKLDILQGLLVSTVLERQIRSFGANGEARGIEIGILRQDAGVVTIEDGARLVVRLAQVVMGEDAANLAAAHTGELVAREGQGQDRAVSIQEIFPLLWVIISEVEEAHRLVRFQRPLHCLREYRTPLPGRIFEMNRNIHQLTQVNRSFFAVEFQLPARDRPRSFERQIAVAVIVQLKHAVILLVLVVMRQGNLLAAAPVAADGGRRLILGSEQEFDGLGIGLQHRLVAELGEGGVHGLAIGDVEFDCDRLDLPGVMTWKVIIKERFIQAEFTRAFELETQECQRIEFQQRDFAGDFQAALVGLDKRLLQDRKS